MRNGGFATDGSHTAFVRVMEFFARFAGNIVLNVSRDGFSHLHRHRADAGQRLSILKKQRHIADGKHFAVTGNAQILFDNDATRAVGFNAERLR